jgi:hypothetical protein
MVFSLKKMNLAVVMDEKEAKNRIYSSSSKDEGEKRHNRQILISFLSSGKGFYACPAEKVHPDYHKMIFSLKRMNSKVMMEGKDTKNRVSFVVIKGICREIP